MVICKSDFDQFVERHKSLNPVAENNEDMRDSYLQMDEQMRFMNCTTGGKLPTKSILDVGVDAALLKSGFDEKTFLKRGGKFKWSKNQTE